MDSTSNASLQADDLTSSTPAASACPTLRARRARAVVYSTLSADRVMSTIARHYRLEQPSQCLLFHRGTNDIYLICSGDQRFAFKLYRRNWRTPEEILGEIAAITHLGNRGVEVAMPVRRSDDSFITDVPAPEGVRRAVLFNWVNGRVPKYTDAEHTLRYGRLVARLHTAADDFPAANVHRKFDVRQILEIPLQRISLTLQTMPAAIRRFNELGRRVSDQLTQARTKLDDWGLCHGDVWAGNARIDGNRIVLFDFDFCGLGWRVSDLAAFRRQAREQGAEEIAWEPFVTGYLQIRPQAVESLKFVGLFMILRHLWVASQIIGLSSETGIAFHTDGESLEDQVIPFCEKIESELS